MKVAQNGTDFKLKPKQKKLAERLCSPDNDLSVKALCEELKIPRRTYYNWLDNEEFNRYMKYLIDKYANSELANIWRALVTQAARGKIDHIKLYFEMLGMMPDKNAKDAGDDEEETGVVVIAEVKEREE